MDEYLRNMKTLRSQMNDFEEEAANVSAEEQKQRTAIWTVEKDLESVVAETRRLKDETDVILKAKGQLCCHILEKQKKISSLEIESATLSQSLELLQQERASFTEKVLEKRAHYKAIQEDLNAKLHEEQEWLNSWKKTEVGRQHDQSEITLQANLRDALSNGSDSHSGEVAGLPGQDVAIQLKSAAVMLGDITAKKVALDQANSKMNQEIEQLKHKIDDFPAEVKQMDIVSLEKECESLLSDKAGELEFLQSLQDRVQQLQGIFEQVKCQCGNEYNVDFRVHTSLVLPGP